MTANKIELVPVSFNDDARAIVRAIDRGTKAYVKATAEVARIMQAYIDKWFIANGKSEQSVKAMGAAIRDSQAVIDLVATGAIEKKTFTEYAQGAMRALHYGVPFAADLKNNPDMALPWGKAKATGTTAKNGKVSTTTRAELDKTLTKALAMARTLGLLEFAADLVDLCTDSLDDFKETINQ